MSEQTRQGLDIGSIRLDDFKPRPKTTENKPAKTIVASATSFPSREAPDDDQLNKYQRAKDSAGQVSRIAKIRALQICRFA